MKILCTMIAAAALTVTAGTASAQVLEGRSISLEGAIKMANACFTQAAGARAEVAVWVADGGGVAIYVKAMDGARRDAIGAARNAIKAALERPAGGRAMDGALPVFDGGMLAGAIAVQGASPAANTRCAEAGVQALTR